MVNFAVIGTGHIANTHLEALNKIKDVKISAICGEKERAEELAKKYNCKSYSDYEDLLKNDSIDVIDIVSQNYLHIKQGKMAALANKNIIIEKPIGLSLREINELIKICKEKNLKFGVIYQRRFDQSIIKLKKLIDEGKLGKIISCGVYVREYRDQNYYDSSNGWRKDKEKSGGGVLIGHVIHFIDILQWLIGDVEYVFGETSVTGHNINVEDTVSGVLKFKNGAHGFIMGTTSLAYNMKDRIEVFGEKGSIVIEGRKMGKGNLHVSNIKDKIISLTPTKSLRYGTHYDQLKNFVDSIKSNKDFNINGEEGKKSLEIVLALYKSAKTGKKVFLK